MTVKSTYPPTRSKEFVVYFKIPMTTGLFDVVLTGLAGRVVVDGRGLATAAPRVVDSVTGTCSCWLSPRQMDGATVLFTATSASEGSLPYSERIHTTNQTLDTMARREMRRKRGWR